MGSGGDGIYSQPDRLELDDVAERGPASLVAAVSGEHAGPGAWLDELDFVTETNYVYFNGKRTARRDPSGAIHYYLGDHLGNTSMVVSAAGAVENESEYYP